MSDGEKAVGLSLRLPGQHKTKEVENKLIMNMDSFDMILTIAALVMGVMLLTGGDVLMKGGNAAERKKLYDEKKVQKVSGVTMLLFAALTGLDMVVKSYVYDIIYLVVVIIIFIIMVVLIRKKCKK